MKCFLVKLHNIIKRISGRRLVVSKCCEIAEYSLVTRFAHSKWVITIVLKFRMRQLAMSGYYLRYLSKLNPKTYITQNLTLTLTLNLT